MSDIRGIGIATLRAPAARFHAGVQQWESGGGEPGEPPAATLLSGATRPGSPQAETTNLVPANARNFNQQAPWGTGFTGLTFGSTGVIADGSAATQQNLEVTLSTPMIAGHVYGIVIGVAERTAGTISLAATGAGTVNPEVSSSFTVARNYVRRLTATGAHTRLRVGLTGSTAARLNYIGCYDMTEMMARPWRIVFIFDAQSNVVGNAATDVNWTLDTPDPRVVYFPSIGVTAFGSAVDARGVGIPLLVQDPLQHATQNLGGGPMGSLAKALADGLRNTEQLVVVACGWAGQGRLNNGAWNPDTNPRGVARVNMENQLSNSISGVLAQAPAGSTVILGVQCGHEADVSVNAPTLLPAAIQTDISVLRGTYGNFPVVMMEMGLNGPELTANAIATMAGLAKLDKDSGDALATPLVKYLPRPAGAGFMSDNVHYNQAANRARGTAAGNAALDLLYGT